MNLKTFEKIVEYGLYLLVFLLPWQTRWIWLQGFLGGGLWEYGTFSLYLSDVLLIFLLILGIGWWFLKKRKKAKSNLIYIIIAFLLISFFSIYWAENKGLGFYTYLKLLEGLGLFWLVWQLKFSLRKLGITLVLGAIIQSALGIWQFLTQSSPVTKWLGLAPHLPAISGTSVVENIGGRFLRAYGGLPHPNILAGYLVIALIILGGLYLVTQKNYQKYFVLGSFGLITTGLFFTFSRTGWLALAGAIILLFLMVYLAKKPLRFHFEILKLVGIVILIFVIFTSLFSSLVTTRVQATERLEEKSWEQRNLYNQQALKLIQSHWLTGVGLGNYTLAVYNEVDSRLEPLEYQPVHNIYALILAETGIFGLIVFILLILEIFKNLWQKRRKLNFESQPWFWVYSLVLLIIFIIFFWDHYFWTLHFGIMLFWLSLGLWQKANQSV